MEKFVFKEESVRRNVIEKYKSMISSLLEGDVNADDFQKQFFDAFKNEHEMGEDVYAILARLFEAVDNYVSNPEIRDEGELDAEGLRNECQQSYEELASL